MIVGLGNPWRGDDGVGPWVARQIRLRLDNRPGVCVLETCGEPVRLLDFWNKRTTVLVIDAVRSGSAAGTLWQAEPMSLCAGLPTAHAGEPKVWRTSSHAFGLAETLCLARALDQLPARLLLYGIEIASDKPGLALTPAVRRAARQLVRLLLVALAAKETH